LEELTARARHGFGVVLGRRQQQVLRVLYQAHFDVLDAEALQGARQLIPQEVRIETKRRARVRRASEGPRGAIGASLALALSDALSIAAPGNSRLRHQDDVVARHLPGGDGLGEGLTEHPLAVAEGEAG